MEPNGIIDVPSPIDLRKTDDARDWAATALLKRPWREEFFAKFVQEIERLARSRPQVLELGSGPGFLAMRILEALKTAEYTAFDFSPAMHELARERLGELARQVTFLEGNFKEPDWDAALPTYDAVITMQAVHELRHKRHAPTLYQAVHRLLRPSGVFLLCDHFVGEGGMNNTSLYMTPEEHEVALVAGEFSAISEIYRKGSLVLYRAQ